MVAVSDSNLTLVQTWKAAQQRFKDARLDSPAIDARLLLEAATGATRTDILTDPYRAVTPEQARTLEEWLERREKREPVARILGRKGFWKLLLKVNPNVLIPRPETETIVDAALRAFPEGRRFDVLDLGVGSGAILLSILAERPLAKGLGVDVSEDALAVARENAANLDLNDKVALLRGWWTEGLDSEGFDLVVCNPPYIRSGEIDALDPEVALHDPRLALDGGPDGLEPYRTLSGEILRVLRPGGVLLVEIGYDQGADVRALFEAAGAEDLAVLKDLGDRDRVIHGRKPLGKPAATR